MKNIILFVVIPIIILSCSPDRYILNEGNLLQIDGFIMSNIDNVKKINDNTIMIYDGGITAMRVSYLTQFKSQFRVVIKKGDGLKLSIRTVSDKYQNHPNLCLEYMLNACILTESGKLLTKVDSIHTTNGSQSLLQIINDGNMVNITVDCDTVYYGRTNLPATEYIILETLKNSEVIVSGILFEEYIKNEL